jgi:triacylglycerol lipase
MAVQKLKQESPGADVVCTGHCLGGVLAQLTAMALCREGKITPKLVTFGTPRFGDTQFAQLANKLLPEALRVVYNQDEVPHVVNTRIRGWYHSFCEIFIEPNGDMTKSLDT